MDITTALQKIQGGIDQASAGIGELVAAQTLRINGLEGRIQRLEEGGSTDPPSNGNGIPITAKLAAWRIADPPPEKDFETMAPGVEEFLRLHDLVAVMGSLSHTKTPAIKAAAAKLGLEMAVLEWWNTWATNTSERVGPEPEAAKDQVWDDERLLHWLNESPHPLLEEHDEAVLIRFLGYPNIAPLHNPANPNLMGAKVDFLRARAEASPADLLFLDNAGTQYAGSFKPGSSVLAVLDGAGNEIPVLPLNYVDGLLSNPEEWSEEVARAADLRFRDNLMIPLFRNFAAAAWGEGVTGKRIMANLGSISSPYSGKPTELDGIFDVDLLTVQFAQRSDMAIGVEEHFAGSGRHLHLGGGWLQRLLSYEALGYPEDGSNVALLANRGIPMDLGDEEIERHRRWTWGTFLAVCQPSSFLSIWPWAQPGRQWEDYRESLDRLKWEKERALDLGARGPGRLADLIESPSNEAYDLNLEEQTLTVHFEKGDIVLHASTGLVEFPTD